MRPRRRSNQSFPSGTDPNTPWSEVGIIYPEDLTPEELELSRTLLPSDETRRQCIQEVTREASEGLTYGQVKEAYSACLTEFAAPTGSLHPSARLLKPETLIARMRRTLDALERHFPEDTRLTHKPDAKTAIDSPVRVHQYFSDVMDDKPQEELHVLMLDTKHNIMGQAMVVRGGPSGAAVDMSDMLRPAVAARAKNLIVVHNHPSGDPTPSPEDIQITQRMAEAAGQLDIGFLDHIILARDGKYTSLAEKGHIPGYPGRSVREEGADYKPSEDAGKIVQQMTLGEEFAPNLQMGMGFESSMAAEKPPLLLPEDEPIPPPTMPEKGQLHFIPGLEGDWLTEGPPSEPVELPPVEKKKRGRPKGSKNKTEEDKAQEQQRKIMEARAPYEKAPVPDSAEIGGESDGQEGCECRPCVAEDAVLAVQDSPTPERSGNRLSVRQQGSKNHLKSKSGHSPRGFSGRSGRSAPTEIRRFARQARR